jgi:hypothetical protein
MGSFHGMPPGSAAADREGLEPIRRCPVCREKIVLPDGEGLVVRNAILRVSARTGGATAKCPRCKAWVEVPLILRP